MTSSFAEQLHTEKHGKGVNSHEVMGEPINVAPQIVAPAIFFFDSR
jgi:hypothetical protein